MIWQFVKMMKTRLVPLLLTCWQTIMISCKVCMLLYCMVGLVIIFLYKIFNMWTISFGTVDRTCVFTVCIEWDICLCLVYYFIFYQDFAKLIIICHCLDEFVFSNRFVSHTLNLENVLLKRQNTLGLVHAEYYGCLQFFHKEY